jgi:hypothetical protein
MKRMAAIGFGGLVLLVGLAGPAAARESDSGSGRIMDVLLDEKLVVVGERTFAVGSQSELRGRRGRSLTLLELEDFVGDPAAYRSRPGQPHPILESIWVDEPDSDEAR